MFCPRACTFPSPLRCINKLELELVDGPGCPHVHQIDACQRGNQQARQSPAVSQSVEVLGASGQGCFKLHFCWPRLVWDPFPAEQPGAPSRGCGGSRLCDNTRERRIGSRQRRHQEQRPRRPGPSPRFARPAPSGEDWLLRNSRLCFCQANIICVGLSGPVHANCTNILSSFTVQMLACRWW